MKARSWRIAVWVIVLAAAVAALAIQPAYADDEQPQCSLATLNGRYVFDASGFNITALGAQPKAIVEMITLNGDGTLTSVATLSANGKIFQFVPGSGSYTVGADCTGTLTFNPNGPHFNIYVAPSGREYHMIQTDANTVLAGVARRVAR